MNKSKVLVIGLDGVSFRLINEWMRNNQLPTLRSLMEDGCWSELESVYPPLTPAAWTSFYTGKNPGKHGLFDYQLRRQGSYQMIPTHSAMVKSDSLFKILSRKGKKVGVVNVPMTYPADSVNGFMITGLFTPDTGDLNKTNFTYPQQLKEEIMKVSGQYRIYPRFFYTKGNIEELVSDYYTLIDQKINVAMHCMRSKPWDFMMLVINETDHIQHQLWHLLDKNHPDYDAREAQRYADVFLKVYQRVDAGLSQLLEIIDKKNTNIVVMSDHGLGPVYKWINLNTWLLRKGYIAIKQRPLSLLKHIMFRFGFTPANIYRLMLRFSRNKVVEKNKLSEKRGFVSRFFLNENDIDWSATKAYSIGHMGQININMKGREPQGVVEPSAQDAVMNELITALTGIKDRDSSGRQVDAIKQVLKKGELFWGPYAKEAADLYLKVSREEYHILGGATFISNRLIERSYGNTATHRTDGIFIACGPAINKSQHLSKPPKIYELAANILYMLGIPIPGDFDGKVIEALFTPEFLSQNEIIYQDVRQEQSATYKAAQAKAGLTDDEIRAAKEMLKKLGYVRD